MLFQRTINMTWQAGVRMTEKRTLTLLLRCGCLLLQTTTGWTTLFFSTSLLFVFMFILLKLLFWLLFLLLLLLFLLLPGLGCWVEWGWGWGVRGQHQHRRVGTRDKREEFLALILTHPTQVKELQALQHQYINKTCTLLFEKPYFSWTFKISEQWHSIKNRNDQIWDF